VRIVLTGDSDDATHHSVADGGEGANLEFRVRWGSGSSLTTGS
jgi:hypothetical protein